MSFFSLARPEVTVPAKVLTREGHASDWCQSSANGPWSSSSRCGSRDPVHGCAASSWLDFPRLGHVPRFLTVHPIRVRQRVRTASLSGTGIRLCTSIAGPVSEVTLMSLPFCSVRRMTTRGRGRATTSRDFARGGISDSRPPIRSVLHPPPAPLIRAFVDPGRHGRLGVLRCGHRVLEIRRP